MAPRSNLRIRFHPAQKGKEKKKKKEVPFVHSIFVFVVINNIPLNDSETNKINAFGCKDSARRAQ